MGFGMDWINTLSDDGKYNSTATTGAMSKHKWTWPVQLNNDAAGAP